MTENQIKYLSYLENARHNAVNEGIASAELQERFRANTAAEGEIHRSNLVREQETERSNLAREKETRRSNFAKEFIQYFDTFDKSFDRNFRRNNDLLASGGLKVQNMDGLRDILSFVTGNG